MAYRRLMIGALTLLSVFVGRTTVQAQSYGASSPYGGSPSYRSMSGMGMFGNRSLGSDLTAGRRTFGGSSFDTNNSFGGLDLGSARFLRGNRQPGEFVGVDQEAGFPGWPQAGRFPSSMMPMGGRYPSGTPSRQNQDEQRTAGPTTTPIRTTYCVAFDYDKPDSEQLSMSLTQRLAELPARQSHSPIQVEVRGRTAILRGVATTKHDRELAEQVVRLEAGIEMVKNEVVVATSTPSH